jgi:hypothetical protein
LQAGNVSVVLADKSIHLVAFGLVGQSTHI